MRIRHHCGWEAERETVKGYCPNCGGALAYDYEKISGDNIDKGDEN